MGPQTVWRMLGRHPYHLIAFYSLVGGCLRRSAQAAVSSTSPVIGHSGLYSLFGSDGVISPFFCVVLHWLARLFGLLALLPGRVLDRRLLCGPRTAPILRCQDAAGGPTLQTPGK